MILSVSLVSGVALILAVQGMVRSVLSSSVFLVEEIETHWPKESKVSADRFRLVPPTSTFEMDLNAVAQALKKRYPTADVESVSRLLPNRLVAQMRQKTVLAQVRVGNRFYPVSQEGTVVAIGQPSPWPNLPLLFLDEWRGSLQVGSTIQHPTFWRACELLGAVHRQGGLLGHGVSSIHSAGRDLTLFLDSGLEIRFASDRLEPGWNRLLELLVQKRDALLKARYIDLRFEDPVIGDNKPGKEKKGKKGKG